MDVCERRKEYMDIAKRCLERAGWEFDYLEPASFGEKSLVYLFHSREEKYVIRLYTDIVRFLRVVSILKKISKFDISVDIVDSGFFIGDSRLVTGYTIEAFLAPCANPTYDMKCDFLERLAKFHNGTTIKNFIVRNVIFNYLFGKWKKKIVGYTDYIIKKFPKYRRILEISLDSILNSSVKSMISLCHKDVGLFNMGLKDGRIYLYDWDACWFFFPFFEFAEVIYFFELFQDEKALSIYLNNFEEGEDLLKDVRVFQRIYIIFRTALHIERDEIDRVDPMIVWLETIEEGVCDEKSESFS